MIYLLIYALISAAFFILGLALFRWADQFDAEPSETSIGSRVLTSLIFGAFWPIFLIVAIITFIKA